MSAANPALAAARDFLRRGWCPLAIPATNKYLQVKGWTEIRLEEKDLADAFRDPDSNVSVHMGQASKGLVDVDVDCAEIDALLGVAPTLLPDTGASFGRPSKRRSHFLYNITDAENGSVSTKQYIDPAYLKLKKEERPPGVKGTLIEIRGNGGQTLMPPSVHPTNNETLTWDQKVVKPAETTYVALTNMVNWLAGSALLLRHYPVEGRNVAFLALSGALLRGGWDVEYAEQYIRAIATAAGDEEVANRVGTVKSTRKRLDEGGTATGQPRCAEVWPPEVWAKVSVWFGLRVPDNSLPVASEEAIRARIPIIVQPDILPFINDQIETVFANDIERHGYLEKGGILFRLTTLTAEEAERTKKFIKREPGSIILQPATAPGLEDDLPRTFAFKKLTSKGRIVPCGVPPGLAPQMRSRAKFIVPSLLGVIHAPIMLESGAILSKPGFDRESGLFLHSDPRVVWPPVPDDPTREDVEAAVDILCGPFSEFPFLEGQRGPFHAVVMSAILTGLQRRTLDYAPLHLFNAAQPGYGKSLLAKAVGIIVTGRPPASFPYPRDNPEEVRKKLTTALISGDPIILFDNIGNGIPFDSDALNTILTFTETKDRVLGVQKEVVLRTNSLFLVTGNNLIVLTDLGARSIESYLVDEKVDDPDNRMFIIRDLKAYAYDNRPELVRAALTILRGYLVAGSPDMGLQPFGHDFTRWDAEIRSPLVWAGFQDPYKTRARLTQDNPAAFDKSRVFQCWSTVFGNEPVLAAEVIAKAAPELQQQSNVFIPPDIKNLKAALLMIASDGGKGDFEKISAARLGKWCQINQNSSLDGLRLVRAGYKDRTALWRVVKVSDSDAPSVPPPKAKLSTLASPAPPSSTGKKIKPITSEELPVSYSNGVASTPLSDLDPRRKPLGKFENRRKDFIDRKNKE